MLFNLVRRLYHFGRGVTATGSMRLDGRTGQGPATPSRSHRPHGSFLPGANVRPIRPRRRLASRGRKSTRMGSVLEFLTSAVCGRIPSFACVMERSFHEVSRSAGYHRLVSRTGESGRGASASIVARSALEPGLPLTYAELARAA